MQSSDVVEVLKSHNAKLYHAHQLLDARHYFQERGILARSRLIRQGQCTEFFTDDLDQQLGVIDSVFFNLFDMGFASIKGNGIGNAYGPILFTYNPEALLEAAETTFSAIQITQLKGRPIQEVTTKDEIHERYKEAGKPYVVDDNRRYAEVICRTDRVSFDSLAYIIVEPIFYNGQQLLDIVKNEAEAIGIHPNRVIERTFREDGRQVYIDLMTWIADTQGELTEPEKRSQRLQRIFERQGRNRMLTYSRWLWNSTFQAM